MEKVAWWGKLAFVVVNIAIASYFANPFAGFGEFFGWLVSLFVSVLVTGIVVAGALMLLALLTRGAAFLAKPVMEKAERAAEQDRLKAVVEEADANFDELAAESGRITSTQRRALMHAYGGKVLFPDREGEIYFDRRTLESLGKRGLLDGSADRGYRITAAGVVCFEKAL